MSGTTLLVILAVLVVIAVALVVMRRRGAGRPDGAHDVNQATNAAYAQSHRQQQNWTGTGA